MPFSGGVCREEFGTNEAGVACWQLGYSRENATWGDYTGAGASGSNATDVTAAPILFYAFCNGGY